MRTEEGAQPGFKIAEGAGDLAVCIVEAPGCLQDRFKHRVVARAVTVVAIHGGRVRNPSG